LVPRPLILGSIHPIAHRDTVRKAPDASIGIPHTLSEASEASFKAILDVLQTNAVPFLVPSPTRRSSTTENQSLHPQGKKQLYLPPPHS
jgi:hypothetical protein